MKLRTLLIAAAVTIAGAVSGFAQLSMAKADWARGPVQYLMTKDEQAQWNAIKNDADADKFIALFWARRDPTPNTSVNEFKSDFDTRVAYADKNFGNSRVRGSMTDRGRILILFGPPTRAVRTGTRGVGGVTTPGSTLAGAGGGAGSEADDTSAAEQQMWTYEGAAAEKAFGAPKVELHFMDRMNNGEMRLEQPRIDMGSATLRVVMADITQPGLKEAPAFQQAPAAAPQPAAPAAPSTSLKTAAFETAVTDAKPSNKAVISYSEFVAPTGDYYVPLALFVPSSAGLAADAADTFFGVVQDATGKRVFAWEDPAALTASKTDFFVDKSLTNLPGGKYTVTAGLAKAGAPVVVTTAPVELIGLTKESTGTSPLILSNNIYEMQTAAPVKTAYAFGKLKIVPKANEVFTNKDELGYFVEVHNPAIDTATNLPKLQMKMDLVDGKGKTVAGAPLSEAQALPLSGVAGPGQYAIINSIPLSQLSKPLAPGEYTLKMKIIDTISKQSYNLEQKFTIGA
jgi:GWxTD domain-containing protein